MDPDALLARLRHAAARIGDGRGSDLDTQLLAADVRALDAWLSGAGQLPTDWREALNRKARS